MGFSLKIEGQETLKYDTNIISGVHALLSSPGDSLAKSTKTYMSLIISGKLHGDSDGSNSKTIKMFKWAQVPAEQGDAYRKVTVQVKTTPTRTITLDKAFVVDYNEMYSSSAGAGTFTLIVRQKVDKIDDVIVDSDPLEEDSSDISQGTMGGSGSNASGMGDYVSTGTQTGDASGVMQQVGRAAVTAALNKVDSSGIAATISNNKLIK